MAQAAGLPEELVSRAKQSRSEKKARKAMSKLGLRFCFSMIIVLWGTYIVDVMEAALSCRTPCTNMKLYGHSVAQADGSLQSMSFESILQCVSYTYCKKGKSECNLYAGHGRANGYMPNYES